MGLDSVSNERVEDEAARIEQFLRRSIDVREVEPVPAEEVEARTASRGMIDQLPEYSVYFRLKTAPLKDFETLDTRGEVRRHLDDLLEMMEMNGEGPDSMVVASDHPPESLNSRLVFYIESAM